MSEAAIERLKWTQESFIQKLPREIFRALEMYTGSEYTDINGFLEGTKKNVPKEMKDAIKLIDKAFELVPKITEPITVYRGLDSPVVRNSRRYGTKETVMSNYKGLYPGFVSTSLDYNVANAFTYSKCCVLKMVLPVNTPAIYLEPVSNREEWELLLPRGTIISINGFDTHVESGERLILSEIILPKKRK